MYFIIFFFITMSIFASLHEVFLGPIRKKNHSFSKKNHICCWTDEEKSLGGEVKGLIFKDLLFPVLYTVLHVLIKLGLLLLLLMQSLLLHRRATSCAC